MPPKKSLLFLQLAASLLLSACTASGTGATTPGTAEPAPGQPVVRIEPAGGQDLSPTTPITVRTENAGLTEVTVANTARGTQVKGTLAPDHASWTSAEPLGYGASYTITAKAVGQRGEPVQQQAEISTLTPKQQAEPNLIPAPGAVARSGIGVGQPIVFQFSQPVRGDAAKATVEKSLSVVSEPAQEGGWYWIDDQNVHYRPREYWQPGTRLTVAAKVYGVDFGGGVYGAQDREETYTVHDSWVAKADGATEQMQVFHSGALVKTMPISLGKDATPTHLGTHVISEKHESYLMDSCTYGVCQGQPGYYRTLEKWSLRISNDGEFVHENPNSVGQQGSANVSHGCVNLNAENAKWFFDNLGLGDVVEVTNSGGPQLPVWDLYGDWSVPWHEWVAGSALH